MVEKHEHLRHQHERTPSAQAHARMTVQTQRAVHASGGWRWAAVVGSRHGRHHGRVREREACVRAVRAWGESVGRERGVRARRRW